MPNLNKLYVVSSQQTTENPYKFEGYKLHHCCNLERILRLVSLIMKGAD